MSCKATRSGVLAFLVLSTLAGRARAEPSIVPAAWQSLPPASSHPATDEDTPAAQEAQREEAEDESSEEPGPPLDPFSALRKDSVEGSLSRVLSASEVAFCKARQDSPRNDPLLCSLSQLSVRQRCPGLRAACSNQPAQRAPSSAAPLGASVAALGDVVFWLLMAAVVVFVGLAVRRMFGAAQLSPPQAGPSTPASPVQAQPAAGHLAETDVARLWAFAEKSALSARFEEAVAALQAALIHALRLEGKLHVSPAQTTGDYLRALRAEPGLHGPAREVFRAVEAVQFGGAKASAELYRKLFEHVQPIVLRVLSLLVLCLFACGQSGCSKPLGVDPEADARGLGVLTRLLGDQHTTVRRRIRALNVIEPEVSAILVVGEQPAEAWKKLLEFAALGGMLVVSESSEELAKATHVHYDSAFHSGRLELPPGFDSAPLEVSAVARHALDLTEDVGEADRTFALANKLPYVAERRYGAGSVLYFGDREFLSNASLSVGDNAFFAVSLLRRDGRVLELVGPWTGGGASSTSASLLKAGLGALLVQLGLSALLFGWQGGAAFGLRRDPIALRRRAFREHVLALGESYRRARATRFALASYGSWLTERLRDRLSPQQPIGVIELAARIAARSQEPEPELVLLLAEAREALDDLETARPSAADLQTLEKLENITQRAGGSK